MIALWGPKYILMMMLPFVCIIIGVITLPTTISPDSTLDYESTDGLRRQLLNKFPSKSADDWKPLTDASDEDVSDDEGSGGAEGHPCKKVATAEEKKRMKEAKTEEEKRMKAARIEKDKILVAAKTEGHPYVEIDEEGRKIVKKPKAKKDEEGRKIAKKPKAKKGQPYEKMDGPPKKEHRQEAEEGNQDSSSDDSYSEGGDDDGPPKKGEDCQ